MEIRNVKIRVIIPRMEMEEFIREKLGVDISEEKYTLDDLDWDSSEITLTYIED